MLPGTPTSVITDEETRPPAEWIVTFGDLMALLLTFFVMLVAISAAKTEGGIDVLLESLRGRFGSQAATGAIDLKAQEPLEQSAVAGSTPTFSGPAMRTGRFPLLGGVVYFAPGQSNLSPEQQKRLVKIAAALAGKRNRIELRGHAEPYSESKETDTLDLAYARCRAALTALTELGIEPGRIRLTVAGEHEPADSGAHPLGYDSNERVEAFLLDDLMELQPLTP